MKNGDIYRSNEISVLKLIAMVKWPRIFIGRKTRAHICPVCLRDKKTALIEQLEQGAGCENVDCVFRAEIIAMLHISGSNAAFTSSKPGDDDHHISQRVLQTLDNIDETVNRETVTLPPALPLTVGEKKNKINPGLYWVTAVFYLGMFVTIILEENPFLLSHLIDLIEKTNIKGEDKGGTENTALWSSMDTNELVHPDELTEDTFGNIETIADPLFDLNTQIFISNTWKGTFGQDSITMVFESFEEGVFEGFTIYQNIKKPFSGYLLLRNEIATVLLDEPIENSNNGKFDLFYDPFSRKLIGTWMTFAQDKIKPVKIQPIEN